MRDELLQEYTIFIILPNAISLPEGMERHSGCRTETAVYHWQVIITSTPNPYHKTILFHHDPKHDHPPDPTKKQPLHVCVQLELLGLVSHSKVALGDSVAACLERHLVARQPAVVAHHCRAVDRRAVDVVVHVTAHVDMVTLVRRLDLPALLAAGDEERNG